MSVKNSGVPATLTDVRWQEKLADRLDPPQNPYRDDPHGWIRHKLDEHMTRAQSEIIESVKHNRYTAVQSCHDVGKSWTASRVAAWWIDTHPPGEAFIVSTAPTAAQVGAILWREIGRAHRKGGLPGYVTGQNEWKLQLGGPPELVGYGRKPQDYMSSTGFQGIHARYVLVILDEACGIPQELYEAADALATNEMARVLAIGNPDDPSSYFKKVCDPGSGWNVLHVDALRSPNFTREAVSRHPELQAYMIKAGIPPSDEDVPDELRDLLVSPTWVAERIKRWGPGSPTFQSKVRGKFPNVSLDTLIDPHWVTLAQARERPPAKTAAARLGVDVARYGTDHSIIVINQNYNLRVAVDIPRGPVTELAGQVQRVGAQFARPPVANVDDVGVGGGVTDILEEEGYPVAPMDAGGRSEELLDNGKPRFVNKRSEWWWTARELLAGESGRGHDSMIDIDPLDDDLAGQLTAVKYKINRHGQIEVESKDAMKKRGLSSPDRADAFIMSLIDAERKGYDAPRQDLMITGDLLTADF